MTWYLCIHEMYRVHDPVREVFTSTLCYLVSGIVVLMYVWCLCLVREVLRYVSIPVSMTEVFEVPTDKILSV